MPDAGCCGMAGPFGFEAKKYDVSQAIGERVLLPAVRNASTDTLIVSDGFSCREQIAQATGRKAMHLAEAIQLALNSSHRTSSPAERLADRHCLTNPTRLRQGFGASAVASRRRKLRRRAALRCRSGPRDASTPTSHFVLARPPEASRAPARSPVPKQTTDSYVVSGFSRTVAGVDRPSRAIG